MQSPSPAIAPSGRPYLISIVEHEQTEFDPEDCGMLLPAPLESQSHSGYWHISFPAGRTHQHAQSATSIGVATSGSDDAGGLGGKRSLAELPIEEYQAFLDEVWAKGASHLLHAPLFQPCWLTSSSRVQLPYRRRA